MAGTAEAGEEKTGERRLSADERKTLAILSLPTLGLALSVTVVTSYLPPVLSGFTQSTSAIGLLIAAEGLVALFLPVIVGRRSDRAQTALGGRLPFLLAATPVMALALVTLGFAGSLLVAGVVVIVFFSAYYVAYEPYRALYPDLVEQKVAGRSQSAQAVARGVGTAMALIAGGLLLSIGQVVPFAATAAVLLLSVGVFAHALLRRTGVPKQEETSGAPGVRAAFGDVRGLLREQPSLRMFVAANALWEGGLAAIRAFAVLFVTVGIGLSLSAASGIIGGAGLFILAGAAAAGKLGDRFGNTRVVQFAALTYSLPMVIPFLTQEPELVLPVLPIIAFSGGVVMALPYAVLFPMMPEDSHGLLSGLYSMSRGVGIMVGPILAGVAIEVVNVLGAPFGTQGYSSMWLVTGVLLVASVPFVTRMRRAG